MSNTNQMLVSVAEETTYRTVPNPAPTLQDLRITGEGLTFNPTYTPSNEMDATAQTADVINTDQNLNGDVNVEHSYGANDLLTQAAMRSAGWSAPVVVAASATITTESIATSSSSYAKIKDSVGTPFSTLSVGQWIKATGFVTNTVNNAILKIYSITGDNEIEVWNGADIVDDVLGDSVTLTQGGQLVNGVAERSVLFEKGMTDITQYQAYLGCGIGGMNLSFPATEIVTGAFNIIGADLVTGVATVGDGSNTAAPTNRVMSGARNVMKTIINGVVKAANQWDFSLANNLRERKNLGTLGPESLGIGEFVATGNFNSYFTDQVQIDLLLANTTMGIACIIQDEAGNEMVYDAPQSVLTAGPTVGGSKNADIMQNLVWQGYKHPTEAITFRQVRFPAA